MIVFVELECFAPPKSRCFSLGELNIGGGGIGPISDTGIGGSGSSSNVIAAAFCFDGCEGGVELSRDFGDSPMKLPFISHAAQIHNVK